MTAEWGWLLHWGIASLTGKAANSLLVAKTWRRWCVLMTVGCRQFVVAAHGKMAVGIGNCQMIMSIRMIGVDGLLYIFNNLVAVEAFHIVAFKE